jgi:D-alanine-D-alanine ligase
VAVLIGGRSTEHEISCVSGGSIVAALDPARYDVTVVGIARDGRWVRHSDDSLGLLTQVGALPEISADAIDADLRTSLAVDVVFPVLHGPWGEDGTVQGLLETLGVPYVGSGVLASALSMDKGFMKDVLHGAGIDVGEYEVVTDRQWRNDPEAVLQRVSRLGLPVFVKPARAGSSLGIVRVTSEDSLIAAIASARKHDPRIIIEAAVAPAREIECGVLVDEEGVPTASRCAEIIVNAEHEFYDFEAKYLDDSATLVVPVDLPAAAEERIRDLAVRAFDVLACEGLVRADFFLRPDGSVVLNEVNTMPGFTSISLFPRMWAAAGVDYSELVDRLIADALRRGTGLH